MKEASDDTAETEDSPILRLGVVGSMMTICKAARYTGGSLLRRGRVRLAVSLLRRRCLFESHRAQEIARKTSEHGKWLVDRDVEVCLLSRNRYERGAGWRNWGRRKTSSS
jgi:hypothetical protein